MNTEVSLIDNVLLNDILFWCCRSHISVFNFDSVRPRLKVHTLLNLVKILLIFAHHQDRICLFFLIITNWFIRPFQDIQNETSSLLHASQALNSYLYLLVSIFCHQTSGIPIRFGHITLSVFRFMKGMSLTEIKVYIHLYSSLYSYEIIYGHILNSKCLEET